MRIGHNLLSINANNALQVSENKSAKVLEKLSSGIRINRAADDAAGLAISEKMRTQIRGLTQGARNAQDGISLIQTAEGALGEVHGLLQRIRELSVQASNDSNTDVDRTMIQKEIDQLVKEVDSTAIKTEFNGMKLLDGSMSAVASTSTPLLSVSESSSMTLQELMSKDNDNLNIIYMEGTDGFDTVKSSAGSPTVAGYSYLKNVLQTQIVPQAVTSVLRSFSPAFNYLSTSSIGIGLNLYSDSSSTTLAAVQVGFSTNGINRVIDNMLAYQLSVNMSSLSYDSNGELTVASRSALETTIVHEMVHGFMDEALTNGMLGVTDGFYDPRYTGAQYNYEKSQNSFPSWFKEGMAQTAAGGYANCNDWVNSGLGINTGTSSSLISSIVSNINNTLSSGSTSSKYGTGYLACMYLGYLASGSTSITAENISNGLGKILSDLAGGKSLQTVISERTGGKYTSISDFESKFGDADSSSFIYSLTQIVGNTGNGGLATGNLTDSDLLPNTAITTSLFALDTQNDTVSNVYPLGVNVFNGGGTVSTGTAPVDNYGSTISDGGTGPVISPGSTIDLSNISAIAGTTYDNLSHVITITNDGDYTLTGVNSNVRIVVNNGVKANITLKNASINTADGAGISLEGSANVTLNLVGTNSVITTKTQAAGIRVTTGATLTIQGDGILTAKSVYKGTTGNDYGAGIGGNANEDGGNIIINGGIINAEGDLDGAGIGGGSKASGGNITINGGTVNSIGGNNGAGIGGGINGSGGNITISGGIVNAKTKGTGAGIGSGDVIMGAPVTGGNITITGGTIIADGGYSGAGIGGGSCAPGGNIIITGGNITSKGGTGSAGIGSGRIAAGGSVVIDGPGVIVKATGGAGARDIGAGVSLSGTTLTGGTVTKTTGIIIEGTSGKVYGDVTFGGYLDCGGATLTVPSGGTLNVLSGGVITNHGTFTNSGRIENRGAIGTVTGTGITHHYVSGISKNIKEPTTTTIGHSLAESIAKFSPSTITVAYNGTTRTLTGIWTVEDMDGNQVTDLAGTIVGENDKYKLTVTFKSEDGIYFDPLNTSIYEMKSTNSELAAYKTMSDNYISVSGPVDIDGSFISYSYIVDSAPAAAVPDPVPEDTSSTGGIKIQVGANAYQFIEISIESIKADALGIDSLSVLTQNDAEGVIDLSDKAIDKVSRIRADLGARQNRLEHAINSINNTGENIQNSESRIRDMDMAKGMMEYSKYQILMQSGQAMLLQANHSIDYVLKLLS